MTLRVGGVLVDADFIAGEMYSFAAGVNAFQIAITSPMLLPVGSLVADSFRMNVTFASASAPSMTWTSITAAPVPETSTFALSLLGLVGLGLLAGSRRRKDS